jgi:hypothetical protein
MWVLFGFRGFGFKLVMWVLCGAWRRLGVSGSLRVHNEPETPKPFKLVM